MGRPLNKKYFGNRNVGTLSTTADNGIGGGALGSISNGTVGAIQINNTYKTFPGLTVAAPTLPDGVTATTAVVWEVATVSLAGGTGYTAGTITSITGLDTFGSPDCRFTITVDGSGVPTFNAFTTRGEFTSIDGTGISTWAVVKDGDGAAQATITFRVKSIAVTDQGSGYVSTPSLSWSQVNGGTMPSAQSVTMLVDSGTVGTSSNQENAIRMTAYLTGGSAVDVDILKQVSTNRYKVTDGTRTGIVKLQDSLANAAGEGSVLATDVEGNTYYATKITAHKATLTQVAGGSNYVYTTGQAAPWKLVAAAGIYVQLSNA